MILQLLLSGEMFAANLAIGMLRFRVNFFVRVTSAFVRKSLFTECTLVRLFVEMNSFMANEVGALNEVLLAKRTLMAYAGVDQEVFLVRVAS